MRLMQRVLWMIYLAVTVQLTVPEASRAASANLTVEGVWQGTLTVGPTSVPLLFNLSRRPDGQYTGTMDSPSQQAFDIALDMVSFENGELRIRINKLGAGFIGRQQSLEKEIVGTWVQSGRSFPLTLRVAAEAVTK